MDTTDLASLKRILERLYNEIVEMHSSREIWQYLNQELPKHCGGIVHETLVRWYVDSQAAAVRRIAGVRSQDKQSFAKLMQIVQKHLSYFTTHNHSIIISDMVITDNLATLGRSTATVSRWADEQVAHIGRKQSSNPTFNELDEAIDTLGNLLQKYYQLIDGGYLSDVKPIIPDDWRRPFRSAWL